MRRLLALTFAALVLIAMAGPAMAEKRVALVIGNAAYVRVGKLHNPVIDARSVRDALSGLGFTIVYGEDLDKGTMERRVADFAGMVGDADVAIVYFAGHGSTFGDVPYVVPIDAEYEKLERIPYELVQVETLVGELRRAKGVRIAILDACRDNEREIELKRKTTRGGTPTRGLVRIKNAEGLIVAYATQYLTTAPDGRPGSNSPFTGALVRHLATPGLDVKAMFFKVAQDVIQKSGGTQRPEISFSLYDDFVLVRGAPVPEVKLPPSPAADEITWSFLKDTTDVAALRRFIAEFPTSARRGEAEARIARLERETADGEKKAEEERKKLAVGVPPAGPTPPADTSVLTAERERALKPKDTFKECYSCPELVVVPAGSFLMGSPQTEPRRSEDEGPQHRVTFSRAFAVGKFAVTFEEWDACVADGGCKGYKPSDAGWGRGKHPVINVDYRDAKAYAEWLSNKTGKTYRLLSEAEREYVTRAGTTTPFWWGSTISPKQANYDGSYVYNEGSLAGDYRQKTLPVDSFPPNPWGLYQVHGNVWEWVEDCGIGFSGAPTDVRPLGHCVGPALRGGSWVALPADLRSARRYKSGGKNDRIGLRVARTLDHVDASPQRTETPPRVEQAVIVPAVPPAVPPETSHTPAAGIAPLTIKIDPLAPERERALKPKDTFKECDACPEMVVMPAGSFMMGSPAGENDRSSYEEPRHRVTFPRPFAVGKFAVTFDEWDACVADGGCNYRPPDEGWGRGKRPVININWDDADAYVAWLSRKTGKTYRLLSEAEREYVTRAGTTTPYWMGSTIAKGQANFSGRSTVTVDSFEANPWGLYQVHGNVWEWTEDCWNGTYSGAPTDGSTWTAGNCGTRVLRGGSWGSNPRDLRSASRGSTGYSSSRNWVTGFRVARTLLTP